MCNCKRTMLFAALSVTLATSPLFAGQLQRADFAGISPYTFDGDEAVTSPHDFGDFSLESFFDMNAYNIPSDAPVALPAPGGENLILRFDSPQTAVGMDVSRAADVYFYGANDALLMVIPAGDIAVWPENNGFAGYTDDGGELIHWVQVGTFDAFLDNVYYGEGIVATESGTLDSIKSQYR